MHYAGIDIGSRTIGVVVVDGEGRPVADRLADTGYDPLAEARTVLAGLCFDRIMATGYGRSLFEVAYAAPTVTEIKAHARAAGALFDGVAGVLDIGGQDSKAIALDGSGRVTKFEMNDRCAAGTGKFLEVMARALGFSLSAFAEEALAACGEAAVSSMCTVFAESEVTSLLARGGDRREIARGLHRSVVRRAVAMLNRVVPRGPLVFSGGVAHNVCVRTLLAEELQRPILLPERPQLAGAYGAALLARDLA